MFIHKKFDFCKLYKGYKMMKADGVEHFSEQGFIEGTQIFYELPEITPEKANRLYNDFIKK